MTPPLSYPYINGTRHDWSSIKFLANGLPIVGITELNYGNELKPGEVYGTLPQKIGETQGQLKPWCNFTILLAEYDNLLDQLCTLNGTPGSGYLKARFDLGVQYQVVTNGVPGQLIMDTVRGVRLNKPDKSHKVGTEALAVKCDCSCFYVLENGRSPIDLGLTTFIPG